MFDVSKLTLDEVGAEIDKTIDKLGRLQALYSAMQGQDLRRIKKLIEEYNQTQREKSKQGNTEKGGPDGSSNDDVL